MEEIIVPFNVNNVLITKEDIKALFKKYDLEIDVKKRMLKSLVNCESKDDNKLILGCLQDYRTKVLKLLKID